MVFKTRLRNTDSSVVEAQLVPSAVKLNPSLPPVVLHVLAALCSIATMACAPSSESAEPAKLRVAETDQRGRIDHLAPAPDSTGSVPERFEWTGVDGADYYDLLVVTEIDAVVWRQTHLRQPSAVWPTDRQLEPGTYFWMVGAIRDNRPIAESGRAAFVVRAQP
jgi:hypothetical protein